MNTRTSTTAAARLAVLSAIVALPALAQALAGGTIGASPKPGTYAQYLVDKTAARHPELIDLDLSAAPPNGSESVVIASRSRERVGRKTDSRDLQVLTTSKSAVAVIDGHIEVDVPLQDDSGATVAAMRAIYPYAKGDDESGYLSQAEALRAEMRGQIPTAAKLTEPAPGAASESLHRGTTQLPTTKQVVSRDVLDQNQQEGYAEAVKHVAGVAPANSKGSANDSIYIRGIKLNLFSNYRLNGGLPIAGVITMPNEDKDRIEALKGANALMFGVASPAGIMNLVTKRAGADITSVSMTGNSFGQYGGSFDVGRRLGPTRQLGIRLNGSAAHLQNGVRNMDGDGEFVSSGVDWRASDRLSLQGDFEYYRKRVPEQAGVSLLDAVNGVIPITPVPDPRNLLSGTWAQYSPQTTNVQLRADYALSEGWKLIAEVGRSYSDRSRFTVRIGGYHLDTGDGGQVKVSAVSQSYRNSFGRIESFGAFSTSVLTHELTFGVSITDRRAETPSNRKEVVLPQTQNIYDPVALAPPVFKGQPGSVPLQISRDGGVYAYDTISFRPNMPRLLVGVRVTQDYENNGKQRDPATCPNCGPDTSWVAQPSFGALWEVLPKLTLFASYMQGLEGGATAPANAANANEILPATVSTQKEVGIRFSQIRGLHASLSLFDIDKANPVTDPAPRPECSGQPLCFVNSGQTNYKGLEATVSADVFRLFTVDAGWQWIKVVQNSPDPKFDGLVPENTPKALANLRVSSRVPWVAGLTLNAGVSGGTSRYVNFQQQGSIPGYAIYSAGAGYVTPNPYPRVALLLNVDNLTNLRYWNSVQTGTYGIGMDRTVRMNMKLDY
jgi:iron complex outermembrane receptor protein